MTAKLATDASHLYRVVDTVRGKFYIGKHGGREQNGYWGSGVRIGRHIKKHGLQDMKYEILVIADEQYILDLERKYVTDEFINSNPNCLNLCKGGVGGNLGGTPWNKGKPANPEHMKKMQALARLKPNPRRGIKLNDEIKAKISKANTGRFPSEEARKKMSAAQSGRFHSQETRDKMKIVYSLIPKLECPHCSLIGGFNVMKRWHFENCKHKEQQ